MAIAIIQPRDCLVANKIMLMSNKQLRKVCVDATIMGLHFNKCAH